MIAVRRKKLHADMQRGKVRKERDETMWPWAKKVESLGADRVVVLEDWPQPAVVAEPRLRADEDLLAVMYRLPTDRIGFLLFTRVAYFMFGLPNDEALGGHPLAGRGLKPYTFGEVLDSSLIARLERQNSVHPEHDREWFLQELRHFVFPFKDATLEVVARIRMDPKPWETFDSLEEAEKAWPK